MREASKNPHDFSGFMGPSTRDLSVLGLGAQAWLHDEVLGCMILRVFISSGELEAPGA